MNVTQNQARGLIVGAFLAAGTALMAPALLSSCEPGQHRAGLSVVSPAGQDLRSGTTILCNGRVLAPRCATYPPGAKVPNPWPPRPVPYRPLPTDSSGALVLQDAP